MADRTWAYRPRSVPDSGRMRRFRSWDGTELAYRVVGSGPLLVCIPGGPQDPMTYRVDWLVRDVEALREHLGLNRMDLFGHSASGGTCLLYAAGHPHRLGRLVLVDPSLRVVGIPSDLGVDEVLARRAHESWYADAVAALHAVAASPQELERYRWLSAPLLYGRWNAAAQAQAAAEPAQFLATPTWRCCREPGTSPGWMTRPRSSQSGTNSSRAVRHRPTVDAAPDQSRRVRTLIRG
jgi:pimeloyl-ACP methyl ester carboxylesterase